MPGFGKPPRTVFWRSNAMLPALRNVLLILSLVVASSSAMADWVRLGSSRCHGALTLWGKSAHHIVRASPARVETAVWQLGWEARILEFRGNRIGT